MSDNDRRLLKPAEVAELLSVSPRKIYKLLQSGELPGLRIGSTIRVDPSKLKDWLAHPDRAATPQLTKHRRPSGG